MTAYRSTRRLRILKSTNDGFKISEEDIGFALEPWKNIHFENFDYTVFENILLTMGNYFFTNYDNENIKVEYSFGYTFDDKENLKIVFHHSSIHYQI